MTVNTVWHDGNLNINSDIDRREINQYATSAYEAPTLGAEILDDTGWTTTGTITGAWSTGWNGEGTLDRAVAITAGKKYLLTVSYTGFFGDLEMEYSMGGVGPIYVVPLSGSTYLIETTTTANLFIDIQFNFNTDILFSLKEITPQTSIYNIYDSTNTKVFSIQATDNTKNNLFMGVDSGVLNTVGYENIAVGGLALSNIISGYRNTSFGYKSMFTNDGGYENVALGTYSLYSNTSYDNVAIGYRSMYSNNSSQNVSIGAYSMERNLGTRNIAFGYKALYSAVGGTGGLNVAIGYETLLVNTTGQYNIALGSNTLDSNTTGNYNIALGFICLGDNTTGQYNIALGDDSLGNNTTGTNNIGLGYRAGKSYGGGGIGNLNSTYSIFLGELTKAAAANGINEIVIGYNATGNGSNTITLGSSSIVGNYLVGTTYLTRTTEQLRVRYNASNYYSTTVGSTGIVTFDAVGSGAQFRFSDSIAPTTSNTQALGTTTQQWADLHLGTGAVVNWVNGDVTLTHATNTLTFAGATTGYRFGDGPITPVTSNGTALGTTALMFSDLFLADGAVINFNNGNVTLTHSAGKLTQNTPFEATTLKATTAGGFISSDGSTGATGTFTTADAKTVTVKDGIITSII